VQGHPHKVASADGTEIGLLTAGTATLAVLLGCGHEAIDAAPGLLYRQLAEFPA
jgi:hypothetical protein